MTMLRFVRLSGVLSIVDHDESIHKALESLVKSVAYRAEPFAMGEEFLNSDRRQETACLIL